MVDSSIAPLAISGELSYRVRVALQPESMSAAWHGEPVAIDSCVDGEVTLGTLLLAQFVPTALVTGLTIVPARLLTTPPSTAIDSPTT